MKRAHAFYAQSGGVTAVINTTAAAVIHTARQHKSHFGTVYAGQNGILGALHENLIDTKQLKKNELQKLAYTPGGIFGSCRYQLRNPQHDISEYQRIIDVFRAHNIRYFFYNGGNDSQDTAYKISVVSQKLSWPLQCIGIPKTIDNDLAITDSCPGFGSVAKYIAVSTREAALDVASMASNSTKVFILEVMGRHAGWIAAASALAQHTPDDAPHIILMPEMPFDTASFLKAVKKTVQKVGYCVIVASEGIRDHQGRFLAEQGTQDAFGHQQLGGVAPQLAQLIQQQLGLKYHWAVADYLQRSARHLASQTDHDHAWAVGQHAVEMAVAGKTDLMTTIVRQPSVSYRWRVGEAPLRRVANLEKKLPRKFIRRDGMHITSSCRNYLQPLIQGEAYPTYRHGMPIYLDRSLSTITPQLEPWS